MIHIVRILLIWLLCLLCVLLHESGHALGYRIAGGKAGWKIFAGSGPEILRTKKYTFSLIPAGGYFIPGEEPGTRKARLAMLAGGPLISLLLAALFLVCRFCFFGSAEADSGILLQVNNFLFYFNLFQFLFTAVPMRYRVVCRGHESDGLKIVHVLKRENA